MKIKKRTLILIFPLAVVAILAFLGTLKLEPMPIDCEKVKKYGQFYFNNNLTVIMQVFAGVSSTIAGFAIAAIVLMVSRTQSQTEHNVQADNMRNIIDSIVVSFIGTFLTSLIAALLSASGSAQDPPDSSRAHAVIIVPLFVLFLSISFLFLGLIMLVTEYKLKGALRATRTIYFISLMGVIICFSI